MKKVLLFLFPVIYGLSTNAQVTGIKNIPGDYATIAAAITALNTTGVGAGGATINITAGHSETAPSGGFRLGSTVLNATTSSANKLRFVGTNNVITSPVGTTTNLDGIFSILGTDFVSISNLTFVESAANTTATTAMEWGVGLFNLNSASPFDGCQNDTIRNCTFTLNRTIATASKGIFMAHQVVSSTTGLLPTAPSDMHNNNAVYSCTFSNMITAVYFGGTTSANDQNNDIGGNSAATGNSMTNVIGALYSSIGAITCTYQTNANISYNTINNTANGGTNAIATAWAIYAYGPNCTYTVNNNNITLVEASISTAYAIYGIYGNAGGANITALNNTVDVTEVAGASAINNIAIFLPNGTNTNISNNTVRQTMAVSGTTYGIYTTSTGVLNVNSNTITQTSTAATSSQFYSIVNGGTSTSETVQNNIFLNSNVSAAGTLGYMALIYTANGTGNKTISGNSISGTVTHNSTSDFYWILCNPATAPAAGTATISGNNFSNVSKSGSGGAYMIYYTPTVASSQNGEFFNNTFSNITHTGTGPLVGVYYSSGNNMNIYQNNISGLTAAANVFGIYATTPSSVNGSVYRNDINNLSSTGTTGAFVAGINVTAGTTTNVYNNFIRDLRASSASNTTDVVRGINLVSAVASSNINVYYNTISLNATSSGANFSTSGIFHTASGTATTAALDMRNNIISNTSTANGTGNSAAFRRSGTALNNYKTTSNNNLFYAGAPSATKLIHSDGTNSDQVLATYKARVTPADAASISVQPNFISATNLHLAPLANCSIEGKGAPIAGYTGDYDGDTRNASTPDIGADEFISTFVLTVTNPAPVCSPTTVDLTAPAITAGSSAGTLSYYTDAGATAPLGNPSTVSVPGTYYIMLNNGIGCSEIKAVVVTITTPASATISYAGTPYCQNAGTATITRTGTAGGTYSSTAGLSINASTGDINLGASTAGTYTVTYGFPTGGGCPAANFTTSVTITTAPNATISYPGSPYCNTSLTAPVTQTGTAGGTYSSTAGLVINATTGLVNLFTSTAGTYTVTYTVAATGGCPVYTTTASITINTCPPAPVTVSATAGTTGPIGYNTLKLAFDAINAGTHQGDITVDINENTNEGATPAVLNGSVAPASYTSINIRPTADAIVVSGGATPASRGVIEFNGADNVTLDGDNPNSAGTNRNLTVTLTGTNGVGLIWIKSVSAANGATNNTIKNCILRGQGQTATTIGILAGSSTFGSPAAAANSNISITNNAFSTTQNGIYWNGFATGPGYDANLNISNNSFGSTVAANKHIFRGMILQNVSNFTISNNSIQGVVSTTTSGSNMSGIQLAGAGNGGNIFNNKISDIKQTNTTGFGAEGITLGFTTTTSNVNVHNNFISDVAGQGWLGTSTPANGFSVSDNGNGIAIVAGGGYNLYYNTVHMNTNQAVNGNPAALLINTVTPAGTLNIRNNIFTNTQTVGTNRYAVISVPGAAVFADINYNDYYTAGPNLGNFAGTNQATIANWRTATTKDVNSVNVLPNYVSATDIHLAATGNCALDGTATPIATYTTDIDGDTRNVTTPDIGADEFTSAPRTATIAYTAAPYCISGGTATVTQTGTTGGVYTAPAGVTINASTGAITLGTSTAGTYTITYTLAALGACPLVTATTSITINAAPSATISYAGSPYCQNAGTATVTQTGTTGGTYSSTAGLTINATTGAVTLGTSTPGTYTVTYTVAAANGCAVYTTTATITITATPNATISYAGSPYCQNAGTASVTQTGTTGGTYSSTAGLTINATTGAVTLGTSTPGTYTITYTVAAAGGCAVFTTTTTITITATPNATISYAGSPYCQNAGTANVTQTGTTGGTYSSTAGLTINASTGAVTLGTSTPGTYTVTYTVAAAGGCAVFTTTTTITITAPPSATISYAGSPYCATGTATVTRTGTAGGTYSSTAGLSINAATGDVNLTASTPGTYTVTYTVAAAGGCAAFTTTTTIVINSFSVAPTAATTSVTTSCGPTTATLTVTGGSLGTGASWKWYSASCGGTAVGTGASITVNVTSTTTYYVRAEGTCNTTACASVTVTINPQPTISITASPYTSLMPGMITTLTANISPVVAGNTITWYRDNVVVSGATANMLTVSVDELGSYTARVTSPFSCTALSALLVIKDSATDKLFITPNPNNGLFKIRYYSNAINFGFLRTVLIYDSKGALVYNNRITVTAPYSSMDVDLRRSAKGLYIVVVADYKGNTLAQGKVVIQ